MTSITPPPLQSTTASLAKERLDEGLSASRSGDARRATRLFEEALALAPGWHLPSFLLGSEYAAMDDFERAESFFAQTVLLAPDFHIARFQLGLLQFSGGRASMAMLTWAPLLSLSGQDEPFPHLVRGFEALAHGDLPAACAHLEAGLPLTRTNDALHADVCKVLAALREPLQTTGIPAAGKVASAGAVFEEEPGPPERSHVLLANYGKATLH